MFDWNQFLELLPLWLPELLVAGVALGLFLFKHGFAHPSWPWVVLPVLFTASATVLQFAPIYFMPLDFLFSGSEFIYWVANAALRLAGWGTLLYGLFWKLCRASELPRPLSQNSAEAAILASSLAILLIEARGHVEDRTHRGS